MTSMFLIFLKLNFRHLSLLKNLFGLHQLEYQETSMMNKCAGRNSIKVKRSGDRKR